MDEIYSHLPVTNPGTIRIIQIEPGSFNTDIALSLKCASLDDPSISYEALSYTWGAPNDTQAVFCDGVPFQATRNLFVALRRLREFKRYTIWADALCINQEDKDERASQVKQMLKIYKQAKTVWMHMGAESEVEHEDKLFELMTTISRVMDGFENDETKTIHISEFATLGLPPLEDESWSMWQRLLSNPYFTRLWVIQEFAVSDPLYIIYGTKYFPWWNLSAISSRMQEHGIGEENRGMSNPRLALAAVHGKNGLGNLSKCHASYHEGTPLRIEFLLWLARFVNCSEPKDKIFAVVGVAGDIDHDDPDFQIRYDDAESVSELFIRTARGMIHAKKSHALELLFEGGTALNERIDHLPSWIPDWTSRRAGSPLGGLADSAGYHAADNLELYAEVEAEALCVRGRIVDRIAKTASEFRPDTEGQHSDLYYGLAVAKWLRKAFDLAISIWPHLLSENGKDVNRERLWRTLICNKTHNDEPAPAEYEKNFNSLLVRQRFVDEALVGIDDESKLAIHDPTAEYGQADTDSLIYQLALQNTMYTKTFCITEEKQMMGMVPGNAEAGDCIVVIAGSPVPCILRRVNLDKENSSDWKLIQECYIHGIMDGESATENDADWKHMMIV